MSEPSNSNGAASSAPASPQEPQDIVAKFRNLLGRDVVLIPVNRGQKAPSLPSWQRTTVADMEREAYLLPLSQGNIGVLLGEASSNLCAIDIDDDAAVEPFLELNPTLRNTLRSKGARGQQVWLRVTDEYPKLTKLVSTSAEPWGEWRAGGGQSVIHGVHPSGANYQLIHEAPPIEVRFEDIVWPKNLKLPWITETKDDLADTAGPPYEVSDNGSIKLNHMFWVRRYMAEHTIVFDSALNDFYEYNATTGVWEKQTEDTIKRRFMDDLEETARAGNLKGLHFKLSEGLGVSLAGLLRTMTEKHDVFSKRPQAIHVKNGMLCREGDDLVLKGFAPEFYSRNVCPYEYDDRAECPRFKAELLGSALENDDILLMQKWAGACLLGRNEAQRFLLLLGTPNGGKSTFMDLLEKVIGIQNVGQLRTEHLGKQFELFGFVGKTLLSGKDVSSDFLLQKSAHVIKALVGHDLLSAEKKGHSEPVPLRGDFNIGITCNADLNVRLEGDLGAWRRRMMIVRYDKQPPARRITDFADKLLAEEGPGILRWMVEGAILLLDDIEAIGDYRITQGQRSRVEGLLAQSDSVRHFVAGCVVAENGSSVTVQDLRRSYLEYCEANGWIPMPAAEVSRQLPEAMLETHRSRQRHDVGTNGTNRGYVGFRVQLEGQHDV
jgi:P4 family phage/plasmid primase-like protien